MADSEGPRDPTQAFADLSRILAGCLTPLSLVGSTVLISFLESQRAFLTWYQKALADPSLGHDLEDHTKALARTLLASYLESLRSQRELREALMRDQAEWVTAYLKVLEHLQRQLEQAHLASRVEDGAERTPRGGA